MRKAAALLEGQEEASGIHTLSLNTIREHRATLVELRSSLKSIESEARELVDSIDVPRVRTSSDPPAEGESMPPMSQEKLEQKLVDMSELIQKMTGPVEAALEEIHQSKRTRFWSLGVFVFLVLLNMGVSMYMVAQNQHLVERIEVLQGEFKAHLISSGLREAQVEQLIKIATEHASTDETRAELKKLTELVDRPPTKAAIEAASRAVQKGVPLDKAIRQAVTSTSHDASNRD